MHSKSAMSAFVKRVVLSMEKEVADPGRERVAQVAAASKVRFNPQSSPKIPKDTPKDTKGLDGTDGVSRWRLH